MNISEQKPTCECCGAEFNGGNTEAAEAGWLFGWDGWICAKCDEAEETIQ